MRHIKWTTTGETRKQDVQLRAFKNLHLFALSKFMRKSWYYIISLTGKQNSQKWRINAPSIFLHRKKKTWKMKIHCLPSTDVISRTISPSIFSGCSSLAWFLFIVPRHKLMFCCIPSESQKRQGMQMLFTKRGCFVSELTYFLRETLLA